MVDYSASSRIALSPLAYHPEGILIGAGSRGRDREIYLFDKRLGVCTKSYLTLNRIYAITFLSSDRIQLIGRDRESANMTEWDFNAGDVVSQQIPDNFLQVAYATGQPQNGLVMEVLPLEQNNRGWGYLTLYDNYQKTHETEEYACYTGAIGSKIRSSDSLALSGDRNMMVCRPYTETGGESVYFLQRAEENLEK